jgi:triacylglycerol lipase
MTYPIILAHGVFRFDVLWNAPRKIDNVDDPKLDRRHYFKGIRTMLKQKGFDAYHSNVAWGAGVEKRAQDLKKNVLKILAVTGAPKVNIIAHSMGGLDSRHMLFNDRVKDRIHERVASLTTISTPHEGSPFADWMLDKFHFLPVVLQKLGLDVAASRDLRTDTCKSFNQRSDVKAFERSCESVIQFHTYAGKQKLTRVLNVLKPAAYIIRKKEGENDGLVSIKSAKWREAYFAETLDETDHLNELGWWDPEQLLAGENAKRLLRRIHGFYARVAQQLP